ncbi:MAG TPA: molybdopterin-dependent oxidoreductase, partial [Acidimicrobiales bacterium]|nr:molybdopterin-dependent oxidoreductase [Acidimicrobiales bacterium]
LEIASQPGALSADAAATVVYRPGELAALCRALASGAAEPPGGVDTGAWGAARSALEGAGPGGEGVVLVLGRPSVAEHEAVVAEAAWALAQAWPQARVLPALRRGNVLGALDMGLAPGVLPGRVSRAAGASWFASAWGAAPQSDGLGTAAMLEELAGGRMSALVLLGADVVGDFPDRDLAERALEAADLVVAVDTFLSPSSARADVVLPATTAHERAGTTTNLEGRVTRLGPKLVAPGQCWPDWMIAAELAARLGADLGVTSAAELWDEIERVAPSHTGITRAVLQGPAGRDGVVAPLAAASVGLPRRRVAAPIDPIATPGIEAVERQGAPPRAGLAEPQGTEDDAARSATDAAPAGRPALLAPSAPAPPPALPAPDSYSLRLVSGRRLYDDGALVEASASLAALVPASSARLHGAELERLGVPSGGRVRVRSGRGTVTTEVVADNRLPRGVVSIPFNLDGTSNPDGTGGAGVAALIDASAAVTDVRLETL